MSTSFETIKDDLIAVSETAKAFIGEFFYEPMGVISSPFLNAATLYVLLGIGALTLYRISKPAPHPRYRKPIEYDYGRNT